MGRVRHNNKLYGKVGDMVYYKLDGQDVVRHIGKVSKKRYEEDEAFAEMRNNMSEFGATAMINKVLRTGFGANVDEYRDATVIGRLNGVMRQLFNFGQGERGKRSFELSKHGELLKGFRFHKERSLASIFKAPEQSLTINKKRNEVSWHIDALDPKHSINIPKFATHFQLRLVGVILSDYQFKSKSKQYEPIHTKYNSKLFETSSNIINLKSAKTDELLLILNLTESKGIPKHTGLVVACGIVFYQCNNEHYYELAANKCMEIVEVF